MGPAMNVLPTVLKALTPGCSHVVGGEDLLGHEGHLLGGCLLDRLDGLDGEHRVAVDVGVLEGDPHSGLDARRVLDDVDDRHREEEPPLVVTIFSETASESARFMNPVRGLK